MIKYRMSKTTKNRPEMTSFVQIVQNQVQNQHLVYKYEAE